MEKKLILESTGYFYNAFGDSGVLLHYLTDYEVTTTALKVGFPSKVLDKITDMLKEKNISYEVILKHEVIDSFKGDDKVFEDTLCDALKKFDCETRVNRLLDKIKSFPIEKLERIIDEIEKEDIKNGE